MKYLILILCVAIPLRAGALERKTTILLLPVKHPQEHSDLYEALLSRFTKVVSASNVHNIVAYGVVGTDLPHADLAAAGFLQLSEDGYRLTGYVADLERMEVIAVESVVSDSAERLFDSVESWAYRFTGRSEGPGAIVSTSVQIPLEPARGDLFIDADIGGIDMYLDGILLGSVDSQLFEGVMAGDHTLELRNEQLRWEGEITVQPGKTTTVKPELSPYGRIAYSIPQGAHAEVSSLRHKYTINGVGVLEPVWSGRYTVSVSGPLFQAKKFKVFVEPGLKTVVQPKLAYSEDYYLQLFEESLAEERAIVQEGRRFNAHDGERIRELADQIQSAPYRFPEMELEARLLIEKVGVDLLAQSLLDRENQLIAEKRLLEVKLTEQRRTSARHSVFFWSSLGVGLLSGGLAGLFTVLADQAYEGYTASSVLDDVVYYRNRFQSFDRMSYISWGLGAAGVGSSLMLKLLLPGSSDVETVLATIESELEYLRGTVR